MLLHISEAGSGSLCEIERAGARDRGSGGWLFFSLEARYPRRAIKKKAVVAIPICTLQSLSLDETGSKEIRKLGFGVGYFTSLFYTI